MENEKRWRNKDDEEVREKKFGRSVTRSNFADLVGLGSVGRQVLIKQMENFIKGKSPQKSRN